MKGGPDGPSAMRKPGDAAEALAASEMRRRPRRRQDLAGWWRGVKVNREVRLREDSIQSRRRPESPDLWVVCLGHSRREPKEPKCHCNEELMLRRRQPSESPGPRAVHTSPS